MSLATISTYVKTHERLILSAVAALVLWFSIGHVEGIIARHDAAKLQQVQAVAQVQQSKDAALAAQATAQAAQFQALAEKVNAQNAALVQANATLATALTKQQKVDATLPPTALVTRWNTLVPTASATVTPTGVGLSDAGALATVQQLEQVPVLSSQIENERTQLGNTQGLLTASQGQVATLTAEVSGLQTQIVDNKAVCTAQVAVVKAEARKSKGRWFLAGYVAGLVTHFLIAK